MNKATNKPVILKGDIFAGSWGYDQTQWSVYQVVDVKGTFAFVRGLNSWSNFSDRDLAVGSKVKLYKPTVTHYSPDKFDSVDDYYNARRRDADAQLAVAPVRTITKMNRIDGQSWTWKWTLDNGDIVTSKDGYTVDIVDGLKRCKIITSRYDGKPYIKPSQSIYASLDTNYDQNKQKYADQNTYTSYFGR